MTQFIQYKSKSIEGLTYTIDINTGEVYATANAMAKLVDKSTAVIDRYLKRSVQKGSLDSSFQAAMLTVSGLQKGSLYSENAILDVVTEYKPKLLRQLLSAGLKVHVYTDTGYAPKATAEQIVSGDTGWQSLRDQAKREHMNFVNATKAKKHPGSHVHDYITKLVTGRTATEARRLPMVNEKENPLIGLNHQPSEAQMKIIIEAKRLYCTYKKGTYQDQVLRAVFHASPD